MAVGRAMNGARQMLSELGAFIADLPHGGLAYRVANHRASKCAVAGDWEGVLSRSSAPTLAARKRIVKLRLNAAIQLKRLDLVNEMITHVCQPQVSDEARLVATWELLASGFPDEAWTVAQAIRPEVGPRLLRMLLPIAQRTKNPDVRKAVEQLREAMLGPAAPKDAGAKALFPARPGQPSRPPLSRLTIVAEPHFAQHRERFLQIDDRFQASIRRPPAPAVRKLENVYLNSLGQIWTREGEVVVSRDRTVVIETPADAPVVASGIACIDTTRSYYHWLIDRFGQLGFLGTAIPRDQVLIAAGMPRFQAESLALMGWLPSEIVAIDRPVFCETLYLGRRPDTCLADWSRSGGVYDLLAANARAVLPHREWPKKVYISRRDSTLRRLENEESLIARLTKLGFATVTLSELSLAEQIETIRRAEWLIAPHGAGLAHIVMADPGLRILELAPVFADEYSLILCMGRLSRCRGHDHTLWVEEINPVSHRWTVDVEKVTQFAEKWVLGT